MSGTGGGHQTFYRGLLRAYPAEYRAEYGEQMVQLFGDQFRRDGAATTWLRAITELPATATTEHLRRNRTVAQSLTVAPTPLSRLLGILGVVGGLILLAGLIGIWVQVSPDLFNLRLVLFDLGAMAVAVGVHLRQSSVSPRLALSAVIPVVLAHAIYMVLIAAAVAQPGEIGPGAYGPAFAYVGPALWLTGIWFASVSLWLGVVSRLSSTALLIGSFASFVGTGLFGRIEQGSAAEVVILAGFAVQCLGWVLLGLEVAFRRTKPVAQGS